MERAEISVRKSPGSSSDLHRSSVAWSNRGRLSQASTDRIGSTRTRDDKAVKPEQSGLGKEIGLLYGGSLVMNAIIGPGIFGTPKGVLAGVGSVGMCFVMWTFSGIFSMCAALCFAELRESVKREGVEYAYITEAFGPLAGFVYSWMRIAAAEPTSTAVFALAFSDYIGDAVFDQCGPPKLFIYVLSTLTIWSMFMVNVMSTKLSERFQMLCSVGKLCALSVVIIMGITRMIKGDLVVINEGFSSTKWSPTDLAFACYNGLWAYGGWANVNHVTSGIKKPPRNVPRVVKIILPIVLIIYILTVLSYFTAMSRGELLHSRAIGVTWAQRVLGPADSLIYIGVGLTALGSLNATLLSSGRLSNVAAKNGQMPDVASWVHVRSKTPLVAIGMRCMIAIIVLLVAEGQQLLRFYIFIVWLFHGVSIAALLILRYKNKKKKRPYKVDLWIPVVVVTVILYLLVAPFLQKPEEEFIAAVALLGLSIVCYFPIAWLKSRYIITVPDQITMWLQLFLRIAPKRDLRRERRSFMRQMSIFAQNSIIITPSVVPSPAVMRRFSRRWSALHVAQASPAVMQRFGDGQVQTSLRKRSVRGNAASEIDLRQKMRSNSIWAIGADSKASPAIIRKKTTIQSRSQSNSDLTQLKSPSSMPILKARNYTTHSEAREKKSSLGAQGMSQSMLSIPHSLLRPSPSPIPEEESSSIKAADSNEEESKSQNSTPDGDLEGDLEVIADFESDGGGEYEVIAHHDDAVRMACDFDEVLKSEKSNSSSSSESSDSESSSNSDQKRDINKSIFTSLFDSSSSSSSNSDSSSDDENDDSETGRRSRVKFYYGDDEIDMKTGTDNPGYVSDTSIELENIEPKINNESIEFQKLEINSSQQSITSV